MRKRKNRGWQTVATLLLVCAVLSYVGFQAYRSIYSSIDTEMAVLYSTFKSIETEGLVYRTETVIPAATGGEPYYTIENGTRVAKSSVIASIYADSESGRIEQQISEIDAQIAAFKTIKADAESGRLTLDAIHEQTSDTLLQLISGTEYGNLSELSDLSFNLLSLLSKKALVTGKEMDISSKIQELEQKKAELKAAYRKPTASVKAPVAGYFVDRIDGYETTLTVEDLNNLSTTAVQEDMSRQPLADLSACGKIVSGYEWYMACIVPDFYYNELGVGRNLTLRMAFVLDESIPVTVYSCKKDNKGNLAVVFRCDRMSSELSTIRKESVEIQLEEYTGLKVPSNAIAFNEKQEAGVFIRSGNVVAFRKIEQLPNQSTEFAICKIINEDGYLQMYDDIIVGGRDLYDGKIIH